MVGVPVGRYWQISNNFHAYLDTLDKVRTISNRPLYNPYRAELVCPFPLVANSGSKFIEECEVFCAQGHEGIYSEPFFNEVAIPILYTWLAWKKHKVDFDWPITALACLSDCKATDWYLAANDWIQRRVKK